MWVGMLVYEIMHMHYSKFRHVHEFKLTSGRPTHVHLPKFMDMSTHLHICKSVPAYMRVYAGIQAEKRGS